MRPVLATALALLACGAAADPPRLAVGGQATASLAPADAGFFTLSDGGYDGLRSLRLALQGRLTLAEGVALLAEVESRDAGQPVVRAAYVRLTPRRGVLDVQAGRIPPVFGAYARRRYDAKSPLGGAPLAYQYLVALRSEALPASIGQMPARRGHGWGFAYPIGVRGFDHGLPLVSSERWDTGVQARVGTGEVHVAAALTQGSPSRPRLGDDNDGKQLSARVEWARGPGLVVGASAARGDWVSDAAWPDGGERAQTALGLDAEWSSGRFVVRGEMVGSGWQLPSVGETVRAWAVMLEGQWRMAPGLTLGARAERLAFSELPDELGSWDARVERLEGAAAWALHRQLIVKAGVQANWRDGGPRRQGVLPFAQVAAWF